MGGDCFEGTERLTHAEYVEIVGELLQIISHMCIKIEPYIPLPEKESHGDIDFLVILKEEYTPKAVVQMLKIEKFIINLKTINTVYRNKQVDFFFVKNENQFELAQFYKSYSGIGAFLGILLPSKEVKISDKGLFCLKFQKHHKLEFLVSEKVSQILKFYGLSYQVYLKGFKTRAELFEYIRQARFFNQEKFIDFIPKRQTKIVTGLQKYLKETENQKKLDHKPIVLTDAREQVLQFFHKTDQFHKQFSDLIASQNKKKQIAQKFNATHIMSRYNVQPQSMKKLKQKFRSQFKTSEEYDKYIQEHDLQEIILSFAKACELAQPDSA